ncbi:MAG: hypothetical protein GXY03_02495 [Solirubrobacterales bacterium]|nr:hypothetical protein [Solirubrobacterales bacterium]
MGALYPLVAELRDMPPARPPGAATRLIDRLRGPDAQWLVTQKAIVDVGNRPRTLGDRLSAALAYVQVLDMPDEVTQAIAEANDYVDRLSKHRSEALKAEWPDILARLQTAKTALQPWWRPERRRARRARQPEDLQR